jgi:hypothetical protein
MRSSGRKGEGQLRHKQRLAYMRHIYKSTNETSNDKNTEQKPLGMLVSGDLSTSFPFVAGTRVPVDIGSHQLWMTVFLELGVEETVAIPSNDAFQ